MHFGKVLIDPEQVVKELGLKKGMHIADFGCGRTGHLLLELSKSVGEEGKVYAVDIVKSHLKMVENLCSMQGACNVEAVWGDYERMHGVAIQEGSLDAVVLMNNMSLLQDHHGAIAEIRRLLKSEGKLVIVDWKKDFSHAVAPPKEKRCTLHDVELLFTRLGFKKLDEIPVSQTHWGLVMA